ncbi:oxidoreductase [Streptomyces sp. N2-109]|uniref:Oxidoreductase n=1 Tax=Streptomyces gossypii TaxID=2883101 RepID=A0ABT2K1Y9_9ACTN|nr:oxidoreductase [Streptomyces gossypii]MCT2593545.1 oxidoreductase [Streptomyces gossypii]
MRLKGKLRRAAAAGLCGAALAAALGTGQAQADGQKRAGQAQPSARWESAAPGWSLKDSGTDARFRGLDAVSRSTAWVAGSGGTVLRTRDGGRHWNDVSPPGAAGLEFRDVEAFGARRAVVLAIGPGEESRVFRTADGGATWAETFRNDTPEAFYNCLTFFDARHGLAVSDPVNGKFRILSTGDGGRSWRVLPDRGMPPAQEGEANFAASGQCLVSSGPRDVWMATGGAGTARVLHSADRGHTWRAAEAPIPAGAGERGVFGLAFRDARHGVAVGGDFRPGEQSPDASAVTGDGGRTWTDSARPVPEYRSGVAWLPHTRRIALAVGPTGTDVTFDGGRNWRTVDAGSYDTVDCADDFGCWASGEDGRIARLEPSR